MKKGRIAMTLQEHYKFHSRKSLKPYFRLILLVFVAVSLYYTFASYLDEGGSTSSMHVAQWSVYVNNERLSTTNSNSLSQSIQLINSADGTTKIDAGDECYFDITINPRYTEVAVSYSITLDLTSSTSSTLPEGTIIEKYLAYIGTEDDEGTETVVNDDNLSISEDVTLSQSQHSLGSDSFRKYRIYCKLPRAIDCVKDQEYWVKPRIVVQQYIDTI